MSTAVGLDVDRFATLMARVDDPFADRERVLADAGLDAGGYASVVASWRARLEGDASGALATRFAEVYAERHARRAELRNEPLRLEGAAARAPDPHAPEPPHPAHGLEPIVHPEPAPAMEPALWAPRPIAALPVVPPPNPLASTAFFDASAFIPRNLLPFAPAPPEQRPPEPPPAPPRPRIDTGTADISAIVPQHLRTFGEPAPPDTPTGPPVVRPPPELASTAPLVGFVPFPATPFLPAASEQRPHDLPPVAPRPRVGSDTADISAFVPRHLFPFDHPLKPPAPPVAPPPAAPPPSAEAGPRRRLLRFDPQTGQPLPVPVWEELPPEPGEKK